ncbi:triphosphoribosyl-dephospho-CoA synthase [Enterobacteriaceae bacterium LUAb1]
MSKPCYTLWNVEHRACQLADHACNALIAEARLTPKPGLVDSRGSGAHQDLSLLLMERSAQALQPTFYALAITGWQRSPDVALRQEIGRIGREGEQAMMIATGGVNTHRGAIWALGLLVTALAAQGEHACRFRTAELAAMLANIADPAMPKQFSNGLRATQRYHVPGAREEAQAGFPHVMQQALPQLVQSRQSGGSEQAARLNALMAIMSTLSDTCVLSRGGRTALTVMQQGARRVLDCGGWQTSEGRQALMILDKQMLQLGVSPGGAADLLAATLLLEWATPLPDKSGTDHGKN